MPKNQDISCAIIDKFTQGGKIDEKRLTYRLVTDKGELDFLIKIVLMLELSQVGKDVHSDLL